MGFQELGLNEECIMLGFASRARLSSSERWIAVVYVVFCSLFSHCSPQSELHHGNRRQITFQMLFYLANRVPVLMMEWKISQFELGRYSFEACSHISGWGRGVLLLLSNLFPFAREKDSSHCLRALSFHRYFYCLAAEDRVQLPLLSWFVACGEESKCSNFITVLRYSWRKSSTILQIFKTIEFAWFHCPLSAA